MVNLERNSPDRRRRGHRRRSRSLSTSPSPTGSHTPSRSDPRSPSALLGRGERVGQPTPRPYMKQVKLHPSGCQQWSSQVVAGGGIYMAYISTLTTYVYDVRDYSLVIILGGNECNIHSLLWHPQNPHRLVVFTVDGRGTEWDVRSEERIALFDVGRPLACTAWNPSYESNLAVVVQASNTIYLLRTDVGGIQENYKTDCSRRSNSDPTLAATCAKWSRYHTGTLAVGWTDGRVSFFMLPAVKSGTGGVTGGKSKLVYPQEQQGAIVDLRHDPNGGAYVLVAYSSGAVVLWDALAHCCISSFERCAVGLIGVRWMAWAPGSFLALSSKTGVAKVFNISQSNAIATVRLGDTGSGIRDMAWLNTQATAGTNSTSDSTPTIGPTAICAFRDGSLSVAHVGFGGNSTGIGLSRALGYGAGCGGGGDFLWASKAGHIETVFACAHRPGDADTLATGSYGSSVKIWHTPTMDLKVTLTGQTGAIYSVSWSFDGDRIASASGEGTVWIWDAESGKAERRFNLHSRAAHQVQWDPFHPARLASAGADKTLVIFSEAGKVERTFCHPDAVYGCNWCPSCADVIATGCQDGIVRVFDVSHHAGSEPQYILSGHTQRVFNVVWSRLLHATLASGSDDTTIIVWCLGARGLPRSNPAAPPRAIAPGAVLRGHTSNVRPLHWNSEIPWLLLSGSWDGTVRAWDIRRAGVGQNDYPASRGKTETGNPDFGGRKYTRDTDSGGGEDAACIAVMRDHVADVYGLSAGDSRPFLYVSASRDTTLRQFTLEGVISSLRTRAVVGHSLANCLGEIRESMPRGCPAALCGQASKSLQVKLHRLRRDNHPPGEASRLIFDFFGACDGMDEFWEVLRWSMPSAGIGTGNGGAGDAGNSTGPKYCLEDHKTKSQVEHATGKRGANLVVRPASFSQTLSLREVPRGLMLVEERVIHRNARRASARALANLFIHSASFLIQDRRLGRLDRVGRAMRQFLAAGDLRSSCEALVTLGRWERALTVAPAAGADYWRGLARRYGEFLRAGGGGSEGFRDTAQGGNCGRQSGPDDSITRAVALSVAIGKPLEALALLQGSDEAFTLAVSVADGAYPPQLSTAANGGEEELTNQLLPSVPCLKQRVESEEGGRGVERLEYGVRNREAEAKLLGLLNEHMAKSEARIRPERDSSQARDVYRHSDADDDGLSDGEAFKAPPKQEEDNVTRNANLAGTGCLNSRSAEQRHDHEAICTAQRQLATTALHEMTHIRAETFFRASQSALGAATLLSVCDGTRESAAPAISLLLRGEEPELAFAAARALRFPARELRPLIREMARRAEAWGDPQLAIELLLDAGGEDDMEIEDNGSLAEGVVRDDHQSIGRFSSAAGRDNGSTGRGYGYWPAGEYGVAGVEAGAREAALVALRAGGEWNASAGGSRTSPNGGDQQQAVLNLRSKSSYSEDAEAALRRGNDVDVVQSFVLAGNIERAAEHAISFLREALTTNSTEGLTLSPPLMPRRLLTEAVAVTRALASSQTLSSALLPARLRNEVLAYASYVGALEAIVRGYHSVVAPLLMNCSVCVQAVERVLNSSNTGRESSGRHHPQCDIDADEDTTKARDEDSNALQPSSSILRVFPLCMSTGSLVLHAIRHLTAPYRNTVNNTNNTDFTDFNSPLAPNASGRWGGDLEGNRVRNTAKGTRHEHYQLQVGLDTARKLQDEGRKELSPEQLQAADHLLSLAEGRLPVGGRAAREPTSETFTDNSGGASSSATSACASDTKATDEEMDNSDRRESRSPSLVASNTPGEPENELSRIRYFTKHQGLSSDAAFRQEIVVSGSRLPSCRPHERVAWRSPDPTKSSTPRAARPTCASREFGQETWPLARGAIFVLEDGRTRMAISNAVMWAKVNPFSPLNTGCRIMPF